MNDLKIDYFVNAIDNKYIEKFIKNNIFNYDVVFEIYNNGLLTTERLQFIIKNNNYIKISTNLIKKLLKDKEINLLDIIFNNFKIFDNEFILKLIFYHKNNTSLSTIELKHLIENYEISTTKDIWNDSNQSVDVYLINACLSGKLTIVQYFNNLGLDINIEYASGKTPLFYACKNGNINLVNYLIEKGNDIDKEDKYGMTPLFIAISSGNEKLIKYLIEQGANINKINKNGMTPLLYACKYENENLVKYLIKHGADVNRENKCDISLLSATTFCGVSPLFYACEGRNGAILNYLIECGADINKKDNFGKTPLFYACSSGNEIIVKYLIERGADIDIKSINGKTPVDYAYKSGNENLVKYLIEHEEDDINKEVMNDNETLLLKKPEDTNDNNESIEKKVNKYLNNEHNKEIFKLFMDLKMYILHRDIFSLNEKIQYNELVESTKNLIESVKKEFFGFTEEVTNIGSYALELIPLLNKCIFDNEEIMERINIHYDKEELSELGIFNMYTNRKPEIFLIKLVNDLDIELYGKIDKFKNNSNYKNKLAKNSLLATYELPTNEHDENNQFKTEYKTIHFKLPSKIANESNIDTDIEILQKEFTENIDTFFKMYLFKKYRTIKNNEMDTMYNEVLQYGLFREIAIHDPMVYGKNIKSLMDDKMEIMENLTAEQQRQLISNLIKPEDGKSLYRQVVNQLSEDFIKKVGDHYQLDEDENGSFIVSNLLENAFESIIRYTGHALFEDIDHLDFKHFPKENMLPLRIQIPQVTDDISKFRVNTRIYSRILNEKNDGIKLN